MGWREPQAPLARAVRQLTDEDLETFHYETALASNMALSADRVELWDTGTQYLVLQRIRNGIQLGLILELGTQVSDSALAQHLKARGAIELFRLGYQATLAAVTTARRAIKRNAFRSDAGPLGAIDLPILDTWAERLMSRHPHLGDSVQPSTLQDLELFKLWSNRLAYTAEFMTSRPLEVGVLCWIWTNFLKSHLHVSGPFTHEHLDGLLQHVSQGDAERKRLFDAFKEWWQAKNSVYDDHFVDTVFETVYDELFTLTRSDLPEAATLQFIVLH
jgi:hypothetical protein